MKPSVAASSLLLALCALFSGGCVHHTRPAPALTEPAAQTPAAPQKGIFTRTADTTWDVLSAPVRLVTPRKVAPSAPPVYEAPDAIIISPASDAATTQSP